MDQALAGQLFENFITKDELAKRLGVSIGLIDKLMPRGLPCLKIGRSVRYRYSDVVAWLHRRS